MSDLLKCYRRWRLLLRATALVFLGLSLEVGARGKITLKPQISQGLDQVVENGLQLQQSLVAGQEDIVQTKLAELESSAKELISRCAIIPHEHTHLVKLLTNLEGSLRAAQMNSVERRPKFLLEAFKSLVELVRSYQIAQPPKIFFCSKDRSEWIQQGWKAQNPIDPKNSLKCGVPAG